MGFVKVNSQIILFEFGIYLFKTICVWIHMCKSRLRRLNKQASILFHKQIQALVKELNPWNWSF